MASLQKIGTVSFEMDGEWDMEDLRSVSESLADAYGLFYPLVAEDEVVRDRLQNSLRSTFWSGDVESQLIGQRLYRQIPREDSLRLKSFHYSSPGTMTVLGVLAVLGMMATVGLAWIRLGDRFIDLWKKVDEFFEKRKALRRPKREFELDNALIEGSDEARALVFDIGVSLGFGHKACETLITVTGNPIAALKFLVVVGREGRKLATLQRQGKLTLPAPSSEEVEIRKSATTREREKTTVERVRQGMRKPKEEK